MLASKNETAYPSILSHGENVLPNAYQRRAENSLDRINCMRPCFFGKALNSVHDRFSGIVDKIERSFRFHRNGR